MYLLSEELVKAQKHKVCGSLDSFLGLAICLGFA